MSLTAEQFRALVGTDIAIGDPELTVLLNGAWQAIEARYGSLEPVIELHHGTGPNLLLGRAAASVGSVSIGSALDPTALEADDYRLGADRRSLFRLETGTNPSVVWPGWEEVTYTPFNDVDARHTVQRKLVELELLSRPGVVGMTEGNFSIQLAQGQSYSDLREEILASLAPGWVFA